MRDEEELIKRLSFENWIWVIYIGIAAFNIYGDELVKKSIREKDKKADRTAKTIFTDILIITVVIYLYFLYRNYKDLEKHPNEKIYKTRFWGSVFTLIGVFCFLYFQLNVTREEDSLSNI